MRSIIFALLLSAAGLQAAETILQLDPAQTHVTFTLSDPLHTVHGTFRLSRGNIHYDFATGKASGEIVIDAKSGESGNGSRDSRMHKDILETDKYPEFVFVPDRVEGNLAKASVHGTFRIHGKDHEMTMTVEAAQSGEQTDVTTRFAIPYVQWGMKDPSTFILRVGKEVNIDVRAVGHAGQ